MSVETHKNTLQHSMDPAVEKYCFPGMVAVTILFLSSFFYLYMAAPY